MTESLAAWMFVAVPMLVGGLGAFFILLLEINRLRAFFADWNQRIEDRVAFLERHRARGGE